MKIVVLGLSHKTAPLAIREKLAFPKEKLVPALQLLQSHVGNGVILFTCNRSELYTLCSSPWGEQSVKRFLEEYHRIPVAEINPYLYTYENQEAVRHLFRVACGLDSMIVGENEILGQVRDAFSWAVKLDMVRGPLSKLFHYALRVGKRVRAQTGLSGYSLSVSRIGVELARRVFGDLAGHDILIVGAGEAGKLVAKALRNRTSGRVLVSNRTFERARALAEDLGGQAVPFPEVEKALQEVDIVISSTGSPGYVLTAEAVAQAMARRSHPLCLIDIALPRDIDPRAKELEGVFLYDMDDLQALSQDNARAMEGEIQKAQEIIEQEVARFWEWWQSLEVVPTITRLREKAERLRQQELAKTLKRLSHLSPEEAARVEALSRALVQKLLHAPITTLKESKSPFHMQALRELFQLEDQKNTP